MKTFLHPSQHLARHGSVPTLALFLHFSLLTHLYNSLFCITRQGRCRAIALLALALLLAALFVPLVGNHPAWAANSGGVANKPATGDYAGDNGTNAPVATGGNVTIDSNVAGNVYGGVGTGSDNSTGNTVTITAGTIGINVVGGDTRSGSGNATGNTVNVSGGIVTQVVYGGWTDGGNASGNTVNISGGTVTQGVFGGLSSTGNATNNIVNISGGTVSDYIMGGETHQLGGSGDPFTGNTLNMNAAPVGIVAVANFETINFTYTGNANIDQLLTYSGQNVTINTNANAVTVGGVVAGVGAITKTGTGTLTLTGTNSYSGGTNVNEGTLQGNTNSIKGAVTNNAAVTFDQASTGTYAGVMSGSGSLTKTGTGTLTLTGTNSYSGGTTVSAGTLQGNTDSIQGAVTNNAAVTFDQASTGTYAGVMSGSGSLTKTGTGTLTLTGANTYSGGTTVSAGTLQGSTDSIQGAVTNNAAVTFDQASAGTYAGAMSGSGSLTKTGAGTLSLTGTNSYTGMTTVMSGGLVAGSTLASSSGLTLYGGSRFTPFAGDTLNGKKLVVNGENNQSATFVGDLTAQNADLHFISSVNPTQPLLTVTGNADISGSTYNLGLAGGTQLAPGSNLTLLEVDAGKTLTATGLTKGSGVIQVGSTVVHDITPLATVDPASGKLVVAVKQGTATEQAKALSEGFLGGMALAVQGADVVAGAGTSAAVRAARAGNASGSGVAAFSTLAGGSMRYNTGSHVDVNSLNMLAGLALGADLAPGRLTVGAFFEYGNGGYTTYNSFSNAASVKGDGNMWSVGGGVLARMDFVPLSATMPGHVYTEASARMGKLHNKYDNNDLRDTAGRTAEYDSSTPYYSLHLGTGYIWNINEKANLDLYAKYFWTRQASDSRTLSTGEALRFDAVDSQRTRLGGRFGYELNDYIAPYVGAAWEYELDGKARGTTNGIAIDSPSMKGSTGIGELGLTLTPTAGLPLSIDFGVQGYTGKKEGVSGNVQLKWEF